MGIKQYITPEQLAELTDDLFSKCTMNPDGTATIPKWAVERWQRQINMPYEDLSEEEKESDRGEARRVIKALEENAGHRFGEREKSR